MTAGEQVFFNSALRGAIAEYVPYTSNAFLTPGSALALAGSGALIDLGRRRYRTTSNRRNHNLRTMSWLPESSKRGRAFGTDIAGGARDKRRRTFRSKRTWFKHGTPGGSPATNKTPTSTSSGNMSTLTSKSVGTALRAITNTAELESHKRSSAAKYRLHAAKYLKMDAMLKELMFPLHRFKGFFGFMSTSGSATNVAVPATSDTVAKLAPRSAWRGISFFKLRHTGPRYLSGYPAPDTDVGQAKVLNAARIDIGSTNFTPNGDPETISSYFRRFNNRPELVPGGNGAVAPPDTSPSGIMSMSNEAGFYKQLWMDFNCADIESTSLQESSFLPLLTASTGQGGGDLGGSGQWSDPQTGPKPYNVTGSTINEIKTNNTLKDAVVRIADGKVEMDITNGSRVPTVVECVIHSMKKNTPATPKTMNTTQIYEHIWKGASYNKSEKSIFEGGHTGSYSAAQGGWNTFWDPKTPFLKVSGPGKKMVDDICNEVHRSVHYLAPGESKTVSIALGSLYYKLGYRSGFYDPTDSTETGYIDIIQDGPGTLAVAIGHFGIDCLETAFSDGVDFALVQAGGSSALEGSGFWVGKRPAPSQIVVSGKYEEAWYPSYMNRECRSINSASAQGSHIGGDYFSAPLGSIAPEQVSTIDGSAFFEQVGAGKAVTAEQN